MMMRTERAKQFMPFDAMKGLQEALRDREERHSRVERHDVSEEQQAQNSEAIGKLEKRARVALDFYHAFHDVHAEGLVTEINIPCRYLKLNDKRVAFEDIYRITVTDMSHDTNTEKEQTAFL
ncbi:MAG: hypothetical protein PHT58_01970 [Eubacteriales bacterium]|nr:hypothetical protein [Eubacteriales bacterium]